MARFDLGDTVPLDGEFKKGGTLFDPELATLTITAPDGTETVRFYPAGGLVHPSLGIFRYGYVPEVEAPDAGPGRYYWVFEVSGEDGVAEQSGSFDVRPTFASATRPEVSDVGALLRARTKSSSSGEIGTFDETTRPTDAQVDELIETAVQHVAAKVGVTLPSSVHEMARRVAALRTAMLVELSYFPEQVRSDKSAYEHYKTLFDEELAVLAEAAQDAQAGEDPGGVDDQLSPTYSFPEDGGGLVGWGTSW